MRPLHEIEMPADTRVETRIAWAGERMHDINEGILSKREAQYVYSAIVGWTDLCTEDARRQYSVLIRDMAVLIEFMPEEKR